MGESAHMATQGRKKKQVVHEEKGKPPAQEGSKKESRCYFCKKKRHMKDYAKYKQRLEKKGISISIICFESNS